MTSTPQMTMRIQGEREVVFTREFDAPRELVFEAMSRPDLLKRWLTGPPGWVMSVCDVDLRVGGGYRYVWTGPGGAQMGMGGIHQEVVPPERIVLTQVFDEDWTGGEAIGTLVLTQKDGRTLMTNTIRYSSAAAREAVLKTPMEQGMAAGYRKLDPLLATLG